MPNSEEIIPTAEEAAMVLFFRELTLAQQEVLLQSLTARIRAIDTERSLFGELRAMA